MQHRSLFFPWWFNHCWRKNILSALNYSNNCSPSDNPEQLRLMMPLSMKFKGWEINFDPKRRSPRTLLLDLGISHNNPSWRFWQSMNYAGLTTHHPLSGIVTLPITPPFDLCTPTDLFWILLVPYDTQGIPRLCLLSHRHSDLPHDCRTFVICAHSKGEQLREVRGRWNEWELADKTPRQRRGGKKKFYRRHIPVPRWQVSERTQGRRVVRSSYKKSRPDGGRNSPASPRRTDCRLRWWCLPPPWTTLPLFLIRRRDLWEIFSTEQSEGRHRHHRRVGDSLPKKRT